MRRHLKWLVALVLIGTVIGIAAFTDARALLQAALEWILGLGWRGYVIFVALYVAACIFFVPGSILTLGAGALFGPVIGSMLVSVAATLGATAAFLVGRYLARDWVAQRIARHATFKAIDRAVAEEGWKIVGLTRLSPVFPFNLLNYAFGLTQVSLRDYILASWIGMMPGTVMYVYIGSLAGAAAGVHERTTLEWALYGIGLVATVIVSILITRIAQRALSQRIESSHVNDARSTGR
jgi:uncharacterized membrane protein YdjX (TVP38/TMEM64 family)